MSTRLRHAERSPVFLDQGNLSEAGLVGHLCFAPPVRGFGFSGGAASCCACVHSGLGGTGLLPPSMGGRTALSLFICEWAESSRRATNWGTLLGASPGFVEGQRTSDGTLVCRWRYADMREPELLR